MVSTERVTFPGASAQLAGRFTVPSGPATSYALFAHCFTCSKDLHASRRVASALAERGIACFSFDFTGLGQSEGEFADQSFTSNIEDLIAAAEFMAGQGTPPSLLVGHSLGGAAVLMAAPRIASVRAVATIAAPSTPAHLKAMFADDEALIRRDGEATVSLAGRPFQIRASFLDDLDAHCSARSIAALGKALLVLHAPLDETVSIDNARHIYEAAKHPKSFVSLDGADHLLTKKDDAFYAADMVAAWAQRYLPSEYVDEGPPNVVVRGTRARYASEARVRTHRIVADEPSSLGGKDLGPTPYELLLASLGACTAMTLRMYADRKKWPLEAVDVELEHAKVDASERGQGEQKGKVDRIVRKVALRGALSEEQRARLMEIADRCPVHRTLHSDVWVQTEAV